MTVEVLLVSCNQSSKALNEFKDSCSNVLLTAIGRDGREKLKKRKEETKRSEIDQWSLSTSFESPLTSSTNRLSGASCRASIPVVVPALSLPLRIELAVGAVTLSSLVPSLPIEARLPFEKASLVIAGRGLEARGGAGSISLATVTFPFSRLKRTSQA